jgi:hypothetical protein
MDSKLDDLPVYVPESRIDLLTNNTSDSLIRNRMRAAYFDTENCVGYATNGHVLVRVPLLERPEIELHGDEEWAGWQSDFDDMLTPTTDGISLSVAPIAEALQEIPIHDEHEVIECPKCGTPTHEEKVGEKFDDDAAILWAGVCYQPRNLARTVLAAADLQKADEVTVYPQEDITYPDEMNKQVVADVGDVRVAIMPFAARPSIHDIYRVEGSTEALSQPLPSSIKSLPCSSTQPA